MKPVSTSIISRHVIAIGAAVVLATACQAGAGKQVADAKPDVRQGQEVKDVCFSSQIRNWRSNDSRSVIVEKGFKEEYKLDLVGGCQPDDAFMSIGLISRVGGGTCLTSGDKLVTDTRYGGGSCMISKIYKWNKDAGKAVADAAKGS